MPDSLVALPITCTHRCIERYKSMSRTAEYCLPYPCNQSSFEQNKEGEATSYTNGTTSRGDDLLGPFLLHC
uniref:Uncharacterized protein n=1 Tax=Arundo donax TaxID=35708 RepID=A0A0A9AHG0_ARUDO